MFASVIVPPAAGVEVALRWLEDGTAQRGVLVIGARHFATSCDVPDAACVCLGCAPDRSPLDRGLRTLAEVAEVAARRPQAFAATI